MATTVYFNGTRADIVRIARLFAAILAGQTYIAGQRIAEGFLLTLGVAALSDIKDAFVTKADGGTDAMGIKWPDLDPKTKAYHRRFGRGEQSRLKAAAGLGRAHHLAPGGRHGLLTGDQLKRWKQIFASMLNRLRLSLPENEAKARAAAIAWSILKREGARTMLQVYGHRKVQILRDWGLLLNSLSPGVMLGSGENLSYDPPSAALGHQIMDVSPGRVIVGTNLPYAGAHDKGVPGKLPRRQIFPENDAQVPKAWWDNWLDAASKALEAGAALMYRIMGP